MLSLRLKEFLLGGPIDKEVVIEESKSMDLPLSTNRVQFLKQLEIDSNALVSEWRNFESEELKTQSSFESVLKAVSEFRSKIDDPDLVGKMQHYTLLQSQVQILILSQKLADLQNFSHVRCIPDLVQNLMNSLPKNLQSSCKIYKNIILGVSELKCSLLRSFHADFDAHLETNAESTDAKEMWSAFLGIARDWLLAYALVSLLPALISDSRNSIIEKYTDALDEVLTPLWGRFHFHLSSARESKSFEQFVWTFSYSKSFLTLLIDLCTQLTSTGQLQKLSAGDFKTAAVQNITEKAVRFVRAHLAQAIVDNSPMSREDCMALVEHTLDFDNSLALVYLPPLSACAVLYDARTIHTQWVSSDHGFFSSYLQHSFGDMSSVYEFRSSFASYAHSLNVSDTSNSIGGQDEIQNGTGTETEKRGRCYNCISDCFYILSLGLQRYVHTSSKSQDIFSRSILEPILNIIVALFLYKIRSDSVLHSISIGLLPSSYTAQKAVLLSQQKSKSNENKLGKIGKIGKGLTDQTEKKELAGNFQTPDCIKDFNDSAEYFQLCLSNLDPRFRLMKGNKIRFHNNWQNLRETFPENFITKKNIENGFTPSNLAEMGMDLASPEKEKNNIDIGVSEVSNLKDKNYLDHDDNFKKVEVEVEVVPNQSESLHFNNSSNNKNKNKSGDNERFNSMSDREIDKNKSSRSTSNHIGRGSSNGVQEENLGGVMDLSITQIFKMSSVINNQWLKINT